jgi:uracil-DNA glycosylase family 4
MDARRLTYLQAMGIDVWVQRTAAQPHAVSAVIEPPAVLDRSPSPSAPLPSASSPTSEPATPDMSGVAGLGWTELEARVRTCQACGLHSTRTQTVFGVGNRAARWMIIGEAPGAEEDRQGEPFVGRAGQLLNAMLKAVGMPREQVFIANILKCRPPGNRDPKLEESSGCKPFLYRQIELVNPALLLCVGRIAAQNLLETDTPIGQLRGKVHRLPSGRPVIVTYHPAYLLRSPLEKRKAWQDLLFAVRTYEQLAAAGDTVTA